MKHRILLIIIAVIVVLLLFVLVEFLVIKYSGSPVAAPTIPRRSQVFGHGVGLTYVVMGDSTSIGQGAEYKDSYAVASAQHLAKKYEVHLINVGVSGAVAKDVFDIQLSKAIKLKPDVALIAVGANDAVHFTGSKTVQTAMHDTIEDLKKANPDIRIVITGSPAMDAIPRFIWPYKQLMGLRTRQVNQAFEPIIKGDNLTFAPVAAKTRTAFLADPTLFAADKFHPNARGYQLWIPVINEALDQALAKPTR